MNHPANHTVMNGTQTLRAQAVGLAPAAFKYDTVGSRVNGFQGPWLYELEGGYQFGTNTGGSDHAAGFTTGGLGYKWADAEWKPTLWCYYDWASGGNVRGARRGFDHLFPLAHRYLGFMDLFARSNISSPNVQYQFQPHSKITVLAWYYYFMLDKITDTPYNVNMSPFAPGAAPRSRDLGHEIDILMTYQMNPRMDIQLGYSHFFAGNYYKLSNVPFRGDGNFYYAQYVWNF